MITQSQEIKNFGNDERVVKKFWLFNLRKRFKFRKKKLTKNSEGNILDCSKKDNFDFPSGYGE